MYQCKHCTNFFHLAELTDGLCKICYEKAKEEKRLDQKQKDHEQQMELEQKQRNLSALNDLISAATITSKDAPTRKRPSRHNISFER